MTLQVSRPYKTPSVHMILFFTHGFILVIPHPISLSLNCSHLKGAQAYCRTQNWRSERYVHLTGENVKHPQRPYPLRHLNSSKPDTVDVTT